MRAEALCFFMKRPSSRRRSKENTMSTTQPGGNVPKSGTNPGLIVGAIAVVVFAAAGTASYMGWIPGQSPSAPATPVNMAQPAQQAGIVPNATVPPAPASVPVPAPASVPVPASAPAAAPEPAPAPVAAAVPAPAPAVPAQPVPAPAPAASAPAPAPPKVAAKPVPPKPVPAQAAQASRTVPSTPSYVDQPASPAAMNVPPQPAAPVAMNTPPPAPKICRNCGTVNAITPIEKPGEGSGAGAVVGGIIGGVLGHQVGSGRGRDVATVAGALGGALVGNEVEKSKKTNVTWEVRVRLEDGTSQVIRMNSEPSFRVGDKVRIEDGKLVRG
jgi:outer membrane lipoprotein SlyB